MATKKKVSIERKATGTKTANPITKGAASGAVSGGVAKMKKAATPIGNKMKKTASPISRGAASGAVSGGVGARLKKTASPLAGGSRKMKKTVMPRNTYKKTASPLTVRSGLNKENYY